MNIFSVKSTEEFMSRDPNEVERAIILIRDPIEKWSGKIFILSLIVKKRHEIKWGKSEITRIMGNPKLEITDSSTGECHWFYVGPAESNTAIVTFVGNLCSEMGTITHGQFLDIENRGHL